MKVVKTLLILFILSFSIISLHAQELYHLEIIASNKMDKKLISKLKYKKTYSSEKERKDAIDQIFMQLYEKAYLLASIDSVSNLNNIQSNYLSLNQKYIWERLTKGNLDMLAMNDIGFHEKHYQEKEFDYNHLLEIQYAIIEYYENHGYPFISVGLDSIKIINNKITAALKVDHGPLILVDTIIIKGDVKINHKYISSLIDIKPGDFYNETKIRKISKQISSVQFAKELSPHITAIESDLASIEITLEKKRANTFDGIIGFQPNSGNNNELILTGNLQLNLMNSFKRGETIQLNWRSPSGGSQNLDLNLEYPYLFNLPIGVAYQFILFKQDSSFLNIRNIPGVSFIINGTDYIRVSANLFSSTTIGTESNNSFSRVMDMKSNTFIVEGNLNRLDYIFNPRKGWKVNLSGGYGSKNIIKQNNYDETFYDSIPLTTEQLQFSLNIDYFIPLFRRQTIRLASFSEHIQGDYLLENELFRLGGFSDLRGFDDQSIYASSYTALCIEWRFLLEKNSYLNVFWNGAYVENQGVKPAITDQPFGFGAGFSFETKAGVFALSYALGSQQGNPIQFSNSKIHFGYLARF